jgi:hypothetical protein
MFACRLVTDGWPAWLLPSGMPAGNAAGFSGGRKMLRRKQ